MSDTPKGIVESGYEFMADWYLQWVTSQVTPRGRYTDKVLEHTPRNPSILELGCGPGVPITRMLLDKGARVVANDISPKQVAMASARCPEAEFHSGDMMALTFEPASFDGAVSFYAIFHLPREEQKAMLSKIYGWIKPGAVFALNFATVDEEEIHGEFLGHGMYWSSYGIEANKAMMADVGFEILDAEELESGDGKLAEDDPDYGVKFLWIAARKST